MEEIFIGESQNPVSFTFQPFSTLCILHLLSWYLMIASIQLYNKSGWQTYEIHNIVPYNMLTFESHSKTFCPQIIP